MICSTSRWWRALLTVSSDSLIQGARCSTWPSAFDRCALTNSSASPRKPPISSPGAPLDMEENEDPATFPRNLVQEVPEFRRHLRPFAEIQILRRARRSFHAGVDAPIRLFFVTADFQVSHSRHVVFVPPVGCSQKPFIYKTEMDSEGTMWQNGLSSTMDNCQVIPSQSRKGTPFSKAL